MGSGSVSAGWMQGCQPARRLGYYAHIGAVVGSDFVAALAQPRVSSHRAGHGRGHRFGGEA